MPEPEKTENMPEPRVKTAKIDAVRHFVQMMKENELTALDFIDGSTKIRLRRQPPGTVSASPSYFQPAPALAPALAPVAAPQPAPVSAPPVSPIGAASAPAGLVIESPMVGTFYSSSSPDAPSFVSVGSSVRGDTTVCIIEAMKVFTDIPAGSIIPAGSSATITEVLVKNGQPVEYGQPLFQIKIA